MAGRIIFESDQEDQMTEKLARQMLDQASEALKVVFNSGKRIESAQIFDNVGWKRRALVIRFAQGGGLRISGMELKVEEFDAEQTPERGEWPEGSGIPERKMLEAAEDDGA